jgi:hypothetical protein
VSVLLVRYLGYRFPHRVLLVFIIPALALMGLLRLSVQLHSRRLFTFLRFKLVEKPRIVILEPPAALILRRSGK